VPAGRGLSTTPSRRLRHDGCLVVFTGKPPHRVECGETHQGHELHFLPRRPSEQIDPEVPVDPPGSDAGEDLLPEQSFVAVGIGWRGPAVPDPDNHASPYR
jgi:hypothetical protein